MVVGGIICSTSMGLPRSNVYALLNLANVINANGILRSACVRLNCTAGEIVFTSSCDINVLAGDIVGVCYTPDYNRQVFIVRDDGINYIFIGSVIISTPDPYNDCPTATVSGSSAEKIGYVTGDTLKSDWVNNTTYNPIIYVNSGLVDVYVDINKADDTGAGTSFATAKKTMKAGWDILDAAGTMHVATGNYSAQTGITYNKLWKLSPEDPNITGEKRVAIPPSV